MNMTMLCADISQPTRSEFYLVHKWAYLLFEELFEQGDREELLGLEVHQLYDRAVTNVAIE